MAFYFCFFIGLSLQVTFAYISSGVLTPVMGFVFQWTTITIFPFVTLGLLISLIFAIFQFTNNRQQIKKENF